MKRVIGKELRKEGERLRPYSIIECDRCGSRRYERKAKQINSVINKDCVGCRPKKVFNPSCQVDGRTNHPLWSRYQAMLQRCYEPANKSFTNYGGRGIYVCARWIIDFWAYVEDIEALETLPEDSTLDRIDNDGPYDPRNIR